MAPKLFKVLTEAKKQETGHYVCPNVAKRYNILNSEGKNVGNNLVNIDVLRVIRWIGLEPSVKVPGRKKKVTVYGFHSLRHSFALNVPFYLFGRNIIGTMPIVFQLQKINIFFFCMQKASSLQKCI